MHSFEKKNYCVSYQINRNINVVLRLQFITQISIMVFARPWKIRYGGQKPGELCVDKSLLHNHNIFEV